MFDLVKRSSRMTFPFRGILRIERDGDDTYFNVFIRQNYQFDAVDDIQLCLEQEQLHGVRDTKPGEVRIFAIHGDLTYCRGYSTAYFDADDDVVIDFKLKPLKRYVRKPRYISKGAGSIELSKEYPNA